MPSKRVVDANGQEGWLSEDGQFVPIISEEQRANSWGAKLDRGYQAYLDALENSPGGKFQREIVEDFVTSAKNAFIDYGQGIAVGTNQQTRAAATNEYFERAPERLAAQERSPVASFIGNLAPEVGLGLLTRGRSMIADTALGTAEGLRFNPDPAEQRNAALLGGGWNLGGDIFFRALDYATDAYRRYAPESTQRALDADLQVSAGQVSPESGARRLDRVGENLPGSDLAARPVSEANQTIVNRAANAAIGETGDTVTAANRASAGKRVAAGYEDAAKALRKSIKTDGNIQLPDWLRDNVRAYFRKLDKLNVIGEFKGLAKDGDGILTPQELLSVHRRMIRQADLADATDALDPALIVGNVVQPLDDIIIERIGEEAWDAFRVAREQGRVLNMLEDTNMVSGGNVNINNMARNARRNLPDAMNRGDFSGIQTPEAEDFFNKIDILNDPVLRSDKDSGTAGRVANMAAGVGLPAATYADPATGIMIGGILGANTAAQAASRRAPLLTAATLTPPTSMIGPMGNNMTPFVSMLDDILYPFVGQEDDRMPQ